MVGPQTLSSKGLKREKTSFLTAHSSQEWLDCRTYNHKVVGLNPTKLTAGFTMSRNCFSKLRLCDSQCINMVFSRKVNKQSQCFKQNLHSFGFVQVTVSFCQWYSKKTKKLFQMVEIQKTIDPIWSSRHCMVLYKCLFCLQLPNTMCISTCWVDYVPNENLSCCIFY